MWMQRYHLLACAVFVKIVGVRDENHTVSLTDGYSVCDWHVLVRQISLKNVLKLVKTSFSISIVGITCHPMHFASSKIIENMLSELHQGQTNPFVSLAFQHRTAHEHCANLNDCEVLVLIPAIIVLLTSNLDHPCNRCHVTLGCSSTGHIPCDNVSHGATIDTNRTHW